MEVRRFLVLFLFVFLTSLDLVLSQPSPSDSPAPINYGPSINLLCSAWVTPTYGAVSCYHVDTTLFPTSGLGGPSGFAINLSFPSPGGYGAHIASNNSSKFCYAFAFATETVFWCYDFLTTTNMSSSPDCLGSPTVRRSCRHVRRGRRCVLRSCPIRIIFFLIKLLRYN